MKSILDKNFKYVPAAATDIKATFAKIKAEQEANRKEQEEKVSAIKPRVKARTA